MSAAPTARSIIYRVDARDRIISVNEQWSQFASSNQGELVMPEHILGQELLGAVSDPSVRQLYREILKRVRGGAAVSFDYRCDAPDWRRTFAMTVRLLADGNVEFESTLLHEEARPTVALLSPGEKRNDTFLIVCSWCQRVKLSDNLWLPVEEAVRELRLLEAEQLPAISHGICRRCSETMMAGLGPA